MKQILKYFNINDELVVLYKKDDTFQVLNLNAEDMAPHIAKFKDLARAERRFACFVSIVVQYGCFSDYFGCKYRNNF